MYDKVLDQLQQDYEPKFKAEFEKQYLLVYQMPAGKCDCDHSTVRSRRRYRHRREINADAVLKSVSRTVRIRSTFLPADNENGQFYEMLTAEELDMQGVRSTDGLDGQLSFGEDAFYQKYEAQIKRLTEKFMPPKEDDAVCERKTCTSEDMEKYADYRNYLDLQYVRAVRRTKDGNVKKNSVDDMAGRDSGGEGQNPKYVALLGGICYAVSCSRASRDTKDPSGASG